MPAISVPQNADKTDSSSVIVFYLNGTKVEDGNIDPEWTLLYYLRNKVGLCGTKLGCGEGGCGACTVLISKVVSGQGADSISHRAVNACLYPACALHGVAVTTIEALGSLKSGLHPLQKRIADAHGSQCGFCTPGFVMAAYALFRANPRPSMSDLETAFQGNLCRCTGYRPILEAYSNLASDFANTVLAPSHQMGAQGCPMGTQCCRNTRDTKRQNGKDTNEPHLRGIEVSGSSSDEVASDSTRGSPCCRSSGKNSKKSGSQGRDTLGSSSDELTSDLGISISASSSSSSISDGSSHNDDLQNGKSIQSDTPQDRKYLPYDPSQDPIFPPELSLSHTELKKQYLLVRGPNVTWIRPTNLQQLLQARVDYPQSKIVVGNTEVGVEVRARRQPYPVMITASGVEDLEGIRYSKDGLIIGAATTLTDIQQELNHTDYLPDFRRRFFVSVADMLHWFAGKQIRNVAAVGGNIITGSPISDLNPIFMALNCELELVSQASGSRTVKMDDKFFTGYRRNIVKPDEILLSVKLPYSQQNEYLEAIKTSRRKEDDIAVVTLALYVRFSGDTDIVEEARVAVGGMAPTTSLSAKLTDVLRGKHWDANALSGAQDALLEDFPLKPGSPGGMERYRSVLMLSLFLRAFTTVARKRSVSVSPELESACSPIELPHAFSSAQFFQDVPGTQEKTDLVGRPIVHHTAYLQASGEAVYCDDMPVRHKEVFLAYVMSTRPHARILSIDASAALAMAGVRGLVTAADVPIPVRHMPPNHYEHEEVFAIDTVHCQGQIIAGVVADDAIIARKAARAVKVQYEDLKPVVLTIEDAIEHDSYLAEAVELTVGSPLEKLEEAAAAKRMVSGEVRTPGQEHFYMEPQSCLAIPMEDGGVELFVSTQHPGAIQTETARILGIPSHRVICKTKRLGGGFGGKETKASSIALPTAVAAAKFRRPVRSIFDRDEDMIITGQRHPALARYKIAADADNRIIAMDIEAYTNAGYAYDLSIVQLERLVHCIANAYRIPHLRVRALACRTNLPSNTAFRGFGAPQGMFFAEVAMRHLAHHLGKDPVQFAEENLLQDGDRMLYNTVLEGSIMKRLWKECLQQANYAERKRAVAAFNKSSRYRKRGLAVVPTLFGAGFSAKFMNQAAALLLAYEDGSILLTHGGTEMGQGLHTKLIQVASRALGIPASTVHMAETATDKIPNAGPTAASVSSDLWGMAVKNACDKLIQRIAPYKEANPEGTWADWVKAAYFDRVNLAITGFFKNPVEGYDLKTNTGRPYNYFCYGVGCCEVEIDTLTGEHQVLSTDIIMDVGESLNPALDIGQIEGGFAQGYGLFLLEEPVVSPDGSLRSRGPGAYKLPAMGDMPRNFRVSLAVNSSNKWAIFSSKAIGEPPLFLAASAFFAVADAISAARSERGLSDWLRMDAPATVEKVRLACEDAITAKVPASDSEPHTPWAIIP